MLSASTESLNEFINTETLIDKLEQPSKVFHTGKHGKNNINTWEQYTETVQSFDLSEVCCLPTSAWHKRVTATVSSFNSNLELPSSYSERSVNTDNVILSIEDPIYFLACGLFGHKFPKKVSKVKNVYSQSLRQWAPAILTCKVCWQKNKKERWL